MHNHRWAYRRYAWLIPLADPHDARFEAGRVARLDRCQKREARYRCALLAHPVASLADGRTKARYLLSYSGDAYLVDDEDKLALFLKSFTLKDTADS